MNKTVRFGVIALLSLVVVLSGCDLLGGGGTTTTTNVIDFNDDDFALIGFDVDGDGDTTYQIWDDGESSNLTDVVNLGGGRISTYDADGDGEADLVDGKYLRVISGRFAVDEDDLGGSATSDGYASLTDKIVLTKDTIWFLSGTVFIGENTAQTAARSGSTVLEIEEGTEVRGLVSSNQPGTLVIDRNGQIDAVGTEAEPIVFTSSRPAGSRLPGDWGGLVINGSAVVQGGTANGEGGTGTYGGTFAADNSGTLQYARVEFGGTLFTPDNELNGIAFQAVGSGTTVDHIQVHKNADDGVEFFGGSVAAKYLLLTGIQDDGLDYDEGWNGSAQFVIIHQYGDGGNAIEADGDAATGGVNAADPVLANFTIIGAAGDNGPNFKSAAEGELWNSIIVNYTGTNTTITESTGTGAVLAYRNVTIEATAASAQDPSADSDSDVDGTQAYAEDWAAQVATAANGLELVAAGTTTGLDFSTTAPDYVPLTGLTAVGSATFPTADLAGNTITAAAYRGAINVGGTDWTSGWTAFPAN